MSSIGLCIWTLGPQVLFGEVMTWILAVWMKCHIEKSLILFDCVCLLFFLETRSYYVVQANPLPLYWWYYRCEVPYSVWLVGLHERNIAEYSTEALPLSYNLSPRYSWVKSLTGKDVSSWTGCFMMKPILRTTFPLTSHPCFWVQC